MELPAVMGIGMFLKLGERKNQAAKNLIFELLIGHLL